MCIFWRFTVESSASFPSGSDFDIGVGHLRDFLEEGALSRSANRIHGVGTDSPADVLKASLGGKTLYIVGMGYSDEFGHSNKKKGQLYVLELFQL